MGITGISDSKSTTSPTRTEPAARREPTPPKEKPLSGRSRADLGALNGVSSFQTTPAGPIRPPTETEAIDRVGRTTTEVARATIALEAANATVQKREATLAQELAQLAPTLSTAELQTYADRYRADHAKDYDAAKEAAAGVAAALERVPGALEVAAGSPNLRVGWAKSALDQTVADATAALGQYTRQSPAADDALKVALTKTIDRLAVVSDTAGAAGAALDGAADLAGGLAGVARAAGSAFGVVGSAADLAQVGGRIADGTARAEHYVSAGVAVAEIGLGVAAVAGVTVGLPVTATLAAIGVVAGAVSARRDRAELERDMAERLGRLGYPEPVAQALATLDAGDAAALRDAGFSTEDIRALVNEAPALVRDGELGRLAAVAGDLGLGGRAVRDLIGALGPGAVDELIGLELQAQTMGVALDRELMIAWLRRDGLDAIADRLTD